jgi:DNA-binding GntR family transcriptional regulator
MAEGLNNRNLRQNVYEEIREFVISTALLPGEKISEDELAARLGVSKTPIREALSKLAHDGIVKIIPNRGSYKVKLSREDISQIMVIREVLEGLCIRLAMANITDEIIERLQHLLENFEAKYLEKDYPRYSETMLKFYALIYDTARNPRLIRMIESISDVTRTFRVLYFSSPERVKSSLKFHKDFVKILERRDVELAEQIRKGMIRSSYEYLMMVTSDVETPYALEAFEPTKDHVSERLKALGY